MWIAWVAWVEWYNFWFFFSLFIVLILLFIVLLKISCGCHVPSFKRQKYVARSIFDRKKHVQQAPLWCARAIVKVLNIYICLFCECRSFFLNFQLTKHVAMYTQLLWTKSQKNMNMMWHYKAEMYIYTCFSIRYMHCECDVGTLSKPCIELIYMAQSALPL